MKLYTVKYYFIILFISLSLLSSQSQNTNTLYVMEEIAERNMMNPAFTPNCKSYFDFIFLPNLFISAGTNHLTLSDIFFNRNGRTQSILSPGYDVNKFINTLPKTTDLNANFKLNI